MKTLPGSFCPLAYDDCETHSAYTVAFLQNNFVDVIYAAVHTDSIQWAWVLLSRNATDADDDFPDDGSVHTPATSLHSRDTIAALRTQLVDTSALVRQLQSTVHSLAAVVYKRPESYT